jgi:hypothetical protein
MAYKNPRLVDAPRGRWRLIDILHNDGTAVPPWQSGIGTGRRRWLFGGTAAVVRAGSATHSREGLPPGSCYLRGCTNPRSQARSCRDPRFVWLRPCSGSAEVRRKWRWETGARRSTLSTCRLLGEWRPIVRPPLFLVFAGLLGGSLVVSPLRNWLCRHINNLRLLIVAKSYCRYRGRCDRCLRL